jgi:hypothetical protein
LIEKENMNTQSTFANSEGSTTTPEGWEIGTHDGSGAICTFIPNERPVRSKTSKGNRRLLTGRIVKLEQQLAVTKEVAQIAIDGVSELYGMLATLGVTPPHPLPSVEATPQPEEKAEAES